jgi:hypothetical protein
MTATETIPKTAVNALREMIPDATLSRYAISSTLAPAIAGLGLEDVGFVQRTADPADARAALVSATPEGLAAFPETQRQRTQVLGEVLGGWTDADRTAFVALLTRLNTQIESAIARRTAEVGQERT